MAYRLNGRAAMTAAGLTVLFMAGTAQAQEYEIRGCRPEVDISTCCPNLNDFVPGSVLISNGRTCRLDAARTRDVTSTGSLAAPGRVGTGVGVTGRNNGTAVVGRGSATGTVTPGQSTGQNPGQNPGQTGNNGNGPGHGNGHDKAKDNAGIGNGPEKAAGDVGVAGSKTDPDNPAHGGGGRDMGGGDKGGGKGGGKDKG